MRISAACWVVSSACTGITATLWPCAISEKDFYRIDFDVNALVDGSFPADGDRDRVRRMFRESLAGDRLGMSVREVDGKLRCSYPIAVLVAKRR